MQSLQDKALLLMHRRGGHFTTYLFIHLIIYTDHLEHRAETKIPDCIHFTEWGNIYY